MTPTNNEPQEPRKGPQSGTPGALLRQAREASGQTQAAVADALHLTVHYVKSLENDDYSKLPGMIFVKGYMRSYARFLKIDADNLMVCYDAHVGTLPAIKSQTLAGNYTRKRNDQAIGWAVAAALVVVMGLGAGWWFFGRLQAQTVASVPPATSAAEQANRTPTATRQNTTQAVTTTTTAPAQTFANAPVAGPATYAAAPVANGISLQQGGPVVGAQTGTQNAVLTESTLLPALPTADVVSGAATILPAAAGQDSIIVAVAPQPAAADTLPAPATTTPAATAPVADVAVDGSAATIAPAPAGGRQINLLGTGADQLQLTFSGNSWVEIDDGRNVRLYSEMLLGGDTLLVQGQAPFHLLFGDGRNVKVTFNSSAIDISSSIRSDSTSRITLSNPATMSVPLEAAAATAPAAASGAATAATAPPSVAPTTAATGNAGAVP